MIFDAAPLEPEQKPGARAAPPIISIVEHQITRVITVMVITGNYSTGKILPESIFGYRVMTFGVEG